MLSQLCGALDYTELYHNNVLVFIIKSEYSEV